MKITGNVLENLELRVESPKGDLVIMPSYLYPIIKKMIQNDVLGGPWAFALAIALLFMGQVVAVVPFTLTNSSLLQGTVVALHPFLLAPAVQILYGCRDGAAVRVLASNQCGPGSIPRLGVICGLSLLVLYSAPKGFLRVLRFPLSSKTNI